MNFKEYAELVKKAENDRYKANCNVASIAGRIYDLMPRDGDFTSETMGRIKNLYAMLGEAIEQARTASDIYEYYITDDACTDCVLDRLDVKQYRLGDEDRYQKDGES
jgi:hypothetical protein